MFRSLRSIPSVIRPSRFASSLAADLPTASAAPTAGHVSSKIPISDVPKVWTTLNQNERSAITDTLLKAQQGDWKRLNLDEKRALFYIAYGEHGPRQTLPKGFHTYVFLGTMGAVALGSIIFYFGVYRRTKLPRTMTVEWQEAANELDKKDRVNPHSGVASDNYKGKGNVAQLFVPAKKHEE